MMGLYGMDACVREVKKAGAVKPAVPALDTASAAYTSALEGFHTAYDELNGYYEKGEHIDDKGKKAATLHPKVMEAFKTFSAADKQLSTTVKTLNRKRRETKIAAREQAEGRNLAVIMDRMMLEAETLVSMPTSPDVAPAALDAQIAAYGKLVDEVDAYAGAHKDETSKWGSLANIKNYDKTFLAATKVVARKRHDKKDAQRQRARGDQPAVQLAGRQLQQSLTRAAAPSAALSAGRRAALRTAAWRWAESRRPRRARRSRAPGGISSVRLPPIFMPATPSSQPLITSPRPRPNENGVPRSRELSNFFPLAPSIHSQPV